MIDIQTELESVKNNFESKYITLLDLIEALKTESNAKYSEIAQYLLLKLLPYEPCPDRHFEMDTGLDSYRYFRFINPDYLMPYRTPQKLYYVDIDYVYFEEVKDALKMLEAFDDIPALTAAITSKSYKIEYKNQIYDSNPFSKSKYKNICFEIEDIKRTLGIDFSDYKTKGVIRKIEIDSVKDLNEDIDFSSITPEFEKQLEQTQSVQLPPMVKAEGEPKGRISQVQRDLFKLLLSKLYPDGSIPNTNAVKEAINAELEKIGCGNISYNTVEKLLNNK